MRDCKLFLCAAFFLLLAALRLLFPDRAAQAQAWVSQTVDPAGSVRALAQALGQELSSAGLRDGLVAVIRLGEEALP